MLKYLYLSDNFLNFATDNILSISIELWQKQIKY